MRHKDNRILGELGSHRWELLWDFALIKDFVMAKNLVSILPKFLAAAPRSSVLCKSVNAFDSNMLISQAETPKRICGAIVEQHSVDKITQLLFHI